MKYKELLSLTAVVLFWVLIMFCTSCTTNFILTSTAGRNRDVVDDNTTPSTTVDVTAEIPLK